MTLSPAERTEIAERAENATEAFVGLRRRMHNDTVTFGDAKDSWIAPVSRGEVKQLLVLADDIPVLLAALTLADERVRELEEALRRIDAAARICLKRIEQGATPPESGTELDPLRIWNLTRAALLPSSAPDKGEGGR